MKAVAKEVKIVMRLAVALLALSATAAWSESPGVPVSTDWVKGTSNQVRLIAGLAVRDGKQGRYAGVEIEIPPGWDTYWRSPGDAGGVAPEFDWRGSTNLKSAQVLYPAPRRLRTKAGDVAGYEDHVVFPVRLVAENENEPIVLHGKVAYGVCKNICVPAEAELQITIPPNVGTSGALTDALADVPRVAQPGVDPSLANWSLDRAKGKATLVLDVSTISPKSADAFVVAPGGVYVPLPTRAGGGAGKAVFEVDLTQGPDLKDLMGKPLTVTMVDDKGQSETDITLK